MTEVESTLRLVEELPASLVESLIQQLRGGQDPRMANPGYQAHVDAFLQIGAARRAEN